MRFDREGLPQATTLFEAASWHRTVRIQCKRCGRQAGFDAHALWWLFERRGWGQTLLAVAKRMRCSAVDQTGRPCGGQGALSLDRGEVTSALPMPPEREWRQAVKRVRS